MVGTSGIEPPTTTMSRWCSTTELRAYHKAAKDSIPHKLAQGFLGNDNMLSCQHALSWHPAGPFWMPA